MSSKRHPDVSFERGTCVLINVPRGFQAQYRRHWQIIGRIEGSTPFLLNYSSGVVTQWQCQVHLGEGYARRS